MQGQNAHASALCAGVRARSKDGVSGGGRWGMVEWYLVFAGYLAGQRAFGLEMAPLCCIIRTTVLKVLQNGLILQYCTPTPLQKLQKCDKRKDNNNNNHLQQQRALASAN